MNLDKVLVVCKSLAVAAGKEILNIYEKNFSVEYKEDKSPLTMADKKSNEVIVNGLKAEFPRYAILSEEMKDDRIRLQHSWCFIVDPLDGTKEFVKRNGEFTVNIALAYQRRVCAGVIYVPVQDKLYFAAWGKGAYLINAQGVQRKLSVTDKTDRLVAVGSRSHSSGRLQKAYEKMGKIAEIKQVGSSLKGCLIAEGLADIYYRDGATMEWDTAAMQCIVEEAGAVFRQMDDTKMYYNRENTLNEKGFYIVNRIENKLDF